MANPHGERIMDERILTWIDARCRGVKLRIIASQFGVAPTRVDTATAKVRDADLAASPDEDVRPAYWKTKKPSTKK